MTANSKFDTLATIGEGATAVHCRIGDPGRGMADLFGTSLVPLAARALPSL